MIWNRSLPALLVPALLVLTVAGGCDANPPTDRATVDQALAEHRYADARTALLAIRQDDPGAIETVRRLAELELEVGDGYSAERYLNDWRRITGETPAWVTKRAQSMILQGKARSARAFLEQTTPAEPEAEARAWLMVWAAMEDNKPELAQEEVMAALARHPQSAKLHARAARLLVMRGDWNTANQHLTAALAADPQNYEALLLQGEGRIASGDLAAALESYRAAATAYPDFAVASANVVGLLIDLGRLDEAQQALKPALTRHPGFHLLRFTAARLDATNKRWAQARATLQALPPQFKREVPAATLLEADVEAELGHQATAQSLYASIANRPGWEDVVAQRLNQPPPS